MLLDDIITLLQSKLMNQNNALITARNIGDFSEITRLEKEISDTETTLETLQKI